jgi:hypothetical protein
MIDFKIRNNEESAPHYSHTPSGIIMSLRCLSIDQPIIADRNRLNYDEARGLVNISASWSKVDTE